MKLSESALEIVRYKSNQAVEKLKEDIINEYHILYNASRLVEAIARLDNVEILLMHYGNNKWINEFVEFKLKDAQEAILKNDSKNKVLKSKAIIKLFDELGL